MPKKLLIISRDNSMEVPFDNQLTIGRDVYNSLSLQDPQISRSHAIIFDQEGTTFIKDLNSRNAIYVNGDKVTEQVIQDGDEIILGSTIIFFNPYEGMDIERALSTRGEYVFEKHGNKSDGSSGSRTVTVFTMEHMEKVVHNLFNEPENTSYFSLTDATGLLRTFFDMGSVASDTNESLRVALDRTLEFLGGDRGVIMESDSAKEKLKVRAIVSEAGSDSRIEISQQILRVVLRAGRCVFCSNVAHDNRFNRDVPDQENPLHSFAACPISVGKKYFGFIYLESNSRDCEYDYVALRSLYLIASHLSALLRRPSNRFDHDSTPIPPMGVGVS